MHPYFLKIDSSIQSLFVYKNNKLTHKYLISSAKNGLGEQFGSYQTPRGWHEIADKIGENAPKNTVFVGRHATGEIYEPSMAIKEPDRDWILTRILRLRGLEPGRNVGENIDSYKRFIYIHGTPDETLMGKTGSRGCIRMRNQDVINLFDQIDLGTPVFIS